MSTTNIATPAMLQALKEQIMKEQFNEQYPVGKGHYIQYAGMDEPSVHFAKYGASWALDPDYAGRVLVGSGMRNGKQYILGDAGGESTHSLTVQEMPQHFHYADESGYVNIDASPASVPNFHLAATRKIQGVWGHDVETSVAGGGVAHNIMQPFKVVGVWKRTA